MITFLSVILILAAMFMMIYPFIGRYASINRVKNKDKHHSANNEYIHIEIKQAFGQKIDLLCTDKEFLVMSERASKNKEDF